MPNSDTLIVIGAQNESEEGAEMRKEAVGYLRVSSAGQIHGHGFARQEETIRDFGRRAGYEITHIYREAWTGTEADRPVFADMMAELLANGCRVVVVESLDRLARDLAVQIALVGRMEANGITLLSASTGEDVTEAVRTDPMSEAMVLVAGVFAQTEKRLLVRKLRRARDAKRAATGRCEGVLPFGTKPGEGEIIDRIRSMRRKPRGRGHSRMSWPSIAEELNAAGVPTRTGRPWNPVVVARIARRTKPSA